MRKVICFVLLPLLIGCSGPLTGQATQETAPSTTPGPEKPNVVFILADDLSYRMLQRHMGSYPNLSALARNGVTFNAAFASESACCPSRATSMTGQYRRNHGVSQGIQGGAPAFEPLESKALPVWLQRAGYSTAYWGRYLNLYDEHVPPGWNLWRGKPFVKVDDSEYPYAIPGYGLDGRHELDGRTHTRIWSEQIAGHIQRRQSPFFVYFAPYSPHLPAAYPKRYATLYADEKAPRTADFDESDVSDKPSWVRSRKPLTKGEIAKTDHRYRQMARATKDLDDAVGRIVAALKASGKLDNTYVVFTSDNGFHYGTHRLGIGKWTPYADDSRVPLIISGPRVDAGGKRGALALNTDLAPTFADWTGADPMMPPDGRSLDPLLSPSAPTDISIPRRQAALLEGTRAPFYPRPAYSAVRSKGHLYVEYQNGERELYDVSKDPLELNNTIRSTDPALKASLAAKLRALKGCVGAECRAVEDTP